MKFLALLSALPAFLTFSTSLASATEMAEDTDPCVQAAIQETYKEFPVGHAVDSSFYEWTSGTTANWQTFKGIRNNGYSKKTAFYLTSEMVGGEIERSFASPEDAEQRKALLAKVSGKRILGLSFDFGEDDLLRYFVILTEDGGSCQVEHLDPKLDDYDNG